MTWLFTVAAGGVGAVARWGIDTWITHRWPGTWPTGVFVINVVGSFLLGLLVALPQPWFTVLGVGACGAFTTFSTLMVGWLRMTLNRRPLLALAYVVVTMLTCVLAAFLGLVISTGSTTYPMALQV